MSPTHARLREVFDTVEAYVERRFGLPVVITDVPDPFTGDLDGERIHIDYEEDVESAVFILVHLVGHTVQWNTDAEARAIGYRLYENPTEEELARLRAYEAEACAYSGGHRSRRLALGLRGVRLRVPRALLPHRRAPPLQELLEGRPTPGRAQAPPRLRSEEVGEPPRRDRGLAPGLEARAEP